MALSSPPTAVAPFDVGRLNAGISAAATSLTVAPIYKTVAGVRTKQGINTTSGCAILSAGDYTELVTYTGASVDATTKVTTITGLTRGRDPTQTTASGSFASGTGRAWAKGTKFTVVADVTYFQSGVFTNVANTFTAAQTMSGGLTLSGTSATITLPTLTTAQRDALTPAEGMLIKNSTTNTVQQYVGGAWASVGTDATPNAEDNVAGKVDLATAAENAAGTATDATSGAPNVIPTSIVKATATGAVSGTVPMLNTSVALDRTIGGLGTVTGTTAYTLIANGTTATGATQNLASAGTSGQVLTSNGASALPTFEDAVQNNVMILNPVAASTEQAVNTTSKEYFTDSGYTYAFTANELSAGDTIVVDFAADMDIVASTTQTVSLNFGTTELAALRITNPSGAQRDGTLVGTFVLTIRTTGATGTVSCSGFSIGGNATWTLKDESVITATSSIDFTGALTLRVGAQSDTMDAANGVTLQQLTAIWNKA